MSEEHCPYCLSPYDPRRPHLPHVCREEIRRVEREAVVDWLRDRETEDRPLGLVQGDPPSSAFAAAADAISRGDHLGKQE